MIQPSDERMRLDAPPKLPVLHTAMRVLFFRASHEELISLDRRHLAFGLITTWLVGMGRYWDDPGAKLAQHLGLGSVIYVFVLSALLWLILWPLRPTGCGYVRVLTFITLVSPPALLYAIPVERFVSLRLAQSMNAWFLATVAAWRVALLFFFFLRLARLRWYQVTVVTLLPLAAIVTALFALNLERVAFDIMGGIRGPGSPNDGAYRLLFVLTFLSLASVGPLLLAYALLVGIAWYGRRREARGRVAAPPVG